MDGDSEWSEKGRESFLKDCIKNHAVIHRLGWVSPQEGNLETEPWLSIKHSGSIAVEKCNESEKLTL